MNGNAVLQQSIGFATYYIQQVMADVSSEGAHRDPGGTMQTIAATYAHAVISTDWQIHTFFHGQPALYDGEWAGKTGANSASPLITPEWGKGVQVDLAQMNSYAQAVFGALMGLRGRGRFGPDDLSVADRRGEPESGLVSGQSGGGPPGSAYRPDCRGEGNVWAEGRRVLRVIAYFVLRKVAKPHDMQIRPVSAG